MLKEHLFLKHHLLFLFLLAFLTRLMFFAGCHFNYTKLNNDAPRYISMSEQALHGNFNFDNKLFLVAPFYPVFLAAVRKINPVHWMLAVAIIQIIVSCLSVIALYYLAFRLFHSRKTAFLAAFLYGTFPITLWYTHTIGQESLFQSFLIFSIFFLIAASAKNSYYLIITSAIFFSLTFLTKSHILLFSPFIPMCIFLSKGLPIKRKVAFSILFTGICLVATLPYGLYNKKVNGVYTLSSNGLGQEFYYGNTEYQYRFVAKTPPYMSYEYKRLYGEDIGFANGPRFDSILALSQKEKQHLFFKDGLSWIKNNPVKFMQLKLKNFELFLSPGLSYAHSTFKKWAFAFLLMAPVYLLAYLGILTALRKNWRDNFWFIGLFSAMLFFSVLFGHQGRFRTITIDPFYLLYASYFIIFLFDKYWKPSGRIVQK